MSLISDKLTSAGYRSHFIGKVCRTCLQHGGPGVPLWPHELLTAICALCSAWPHRPKISPRGATPLSHPNQKWHVGMATHAQTPVARGFASSLGYFHSRNDYFTQQRAEGCGGKLYIDLWDTDGPARGLNGCVILNRPYLCQSVDKRVEFAYCGGAPASLT